MHALSRFVLRHAALIVICAVLLTAAAGVFTVKLYQDLRLELEELPAEEGAGLWPQPLHAELAAG